MTDLITLSASKMKTFATCPKKYWYEYVQRSDKKKHPAAVLGTAVHRTIERLHTEEYPKEDSVVLLAEEYQKESLAADVPMDSKLFSDGIKMVDLYDIMKWQPKETEKLFELAFPNQAHPLCNIIGYFDQIYDEGFADLKTNKIKPMRGVLDNNLQFIIYTWAFKEIYGYDPSMRIWNHLRTGEDFKADTLGKVDRAQRVIERILDAEITGIYDPNVDDMVCRICSYRLPCLGRED